MIKQRIVKWHFIDGKYIPSYYEAPSIEQKLKLTKLNIERTQKQLDGEYKKGMKEETHWKLYKLYHQINKLDTELLFKYDFWNYEHFKIK